MMRNDIVLRCDAMDILIASLGAVDAERFISIVNRDRFDYTEWRRENLCKGMTLDEIYEDAAEYGAKT
jgi:hypothetical protein